MNNLVKCIALIVQGEIQEWPQDIVELAGAWKNDEFPSLDILRSIEEEDVKREEL